MNESRASDGDGSGKTLRVVTGSRLHFGLLDTAEPFGGVGVMVNEPATEIVVTPAEQFDCEDDASERIRGIADRVAQLAGVAELPACRVEIRRRPQAHTGMGSGTQLAMAAAEALCQFSGLVISSTDLATKVAGRGQRSAVGIHGYFEGGLIFEAADEPCEINPVRARAALPSPWCVALFQPKARCVSVSGNQERDQFARLTAVDPDVRAGLSRLVTERMLPAALAGDFNAFADSVGQYNYQSGMLFDSVQRGAYSGGPVTELIDLLRRRGGCGVGQSSWGPGVFAWFESTTHAREFERNLPSGLADCTLTTVRNRARTIKTVS